MSYSEQIAYLQFLVRSREVQAHRKPGYVLVRLGYPYITRFLEGMHLLISTIFILELLATVRSKGYATSPVQFILNKKNGET